MLFDSKRSARIVVAASLTLAGWPLAVAEDDGKAVQAEFGGPNSVPATVEDDAEEKRPVFETGVLDEFHAWKKELAQRTGVSFGADYSAVFFDASESLGADDASGGMLRLYGSWAAVGRESGNTGSIVWKVEHRHGYGEPPPSGLGFELGAVGILEPPFSDQGTRLTNFYWNQKLAEGRITLVGGFLDATDYVDVYALASPWTGFTNFAFSTGTTTISLPNDALLGVAAGGMVSDEVYVVAGFGDTNSDPTDPFEGFETFFGDHELFKHVEVGWTTSQDRIYVDNVHLTIWHADEREEAAVPDDWGVNVSYAMQIAERWSPFVRAGWADEGVALMDASASAGFGYTPRNGWDQVGFGVNWGSPSESFGPDLDDQYTMEAFYKIQLSDETAITPDVQLIVDPALNPDESSIWIFGVRLRIAI